MRSFKFQISARVVEGVIRDVLLGEDADEAAKAKTQSIFEKMNDDDDGEAEYIAEVKNVQQLLLCFRYLQYDASFVPFRRFCKSLRL
jgi:hypothetical protein